MHEASDYRSGSSKCSYIEWSNLELKMVGSTQTSRARKNVML